MHTRTQVHNERLFTAEEACAIVPKVVYHMETYEPELLRSAIPNYFLAELASSQVKMVLTGEGADELFAGYLYFRDAPDAAALQAECRRIFGHLQNVNLQRADRMAMAHGLEARVPFLDLDFVHTAFSVDPRDKMIVAGDPARYETKQYLREIFAQTTSGGDGGGGAPVAAKARAQGQDGDGLVPHELLFRTKAMQCEGVGQGWVHTLQEYASQQVSEEEFQALRTQFAQKHPPLSREEAWYRTLLFKFAVTSPSMVDIYEDAFRLNRLNVFFSEIRPGTGSSSSRISRDRTNSCMCGRAAVALPALGMSHTHIYMQMYMCMYISIWAAVALPALGMSHTHIYMQM